MGVGVRSVMGLSGGTRKSSSILSVPRGASAPPNDPITERMPWVSTLSESEQIRLRNLQVFGQRLLASARCIQLISAVRDVLQKYMDSKRS